MDRSSATRERQLAELLVLVKARADRGPFPLRRLPAVMVHAIEVGAPRCARPGRNVLQRLQQRVGDEKLRAPSLDRRPRLSRSADDAGVPAGHTIALVVPWPPAQEASAEVGDDDR